MKRKYSFFSLSVSIVSLIVGFLLPMMIKYPIFIESENYDRPCEEELDSCFRQAEVLLKTNARFLYENQELKKIK